MLAYARDRVIRPIDDAQRVVLPGNRHPLARPEFRLKPVPSDFPMERMMLVLSPDAEQQAAARRSGGAAAATLIHLITINGLLRNASDSFLARRKGTLRLVVNWLQAHGMNVEEVSPGRRSIVFSGNAGQVTTAFHTRIQSYKVGGEVHHANENDPEIPKALAGVVGGVVSLHDFQTEPMHVTPTYNPVPSPSPSFSSGSTHYLTPADFATIYNLNPLYQNLTDGSGQNIAIVGRSNINLSDVRLFRSNFGLPAKDPQIILNGADPGIFDTNEESEAVLDVEWSGAVAKNATIKFVVSEVHELERWNLSFGAVHREPQHRASHEHEFRALRGGAWFFGK